MLLKKRERDLERQVMIFFEMIAQVYKYMLKLELNVSMCLHVNFWNFACE